MPRKVSVTKQMIENVSIDMIKNGETLNARAIAKHLDCSIQPIFYNFATMDDLKDAVNKRILKIFEKYIDDHANSDKYPPFKAIGFAYIGFAKDYPEYFKLLFMDEKGASVMSMAGSTQRMMTDLLVKMLGCNKQTAMLIQTEMWVFVHGFATMIATKYIQWDEQSVSEMLTDVFEGLKLKLHLK